MALPKSQSERKRWRGLVRAALLELLYSDQPSQRTTSSAIHMHKSLYRDLEPWYDFNLFIQDNLEEALKKTPKGPTDQSKDEPDEYELPEFLFDNDRRKEWNTCGDEKSVMGRFSEHIANPLNCIARRNFDETSNFSDWKTRWNSTYGTPSELLESSSMRSVKDRAPVTPQEARKLIPADWKKEPDFILTRKVGYWHLLVGEGKSPWISNHQIHFLNDLWTNPTEIDVQANAKRTFGQIGEYMKTLRLKYGFYTNYEETVFFKMVRATQEVSSQKRGSTTQPWTLTFSPVVRWDMELKANDQVEKLGLCLVAEESDFSELTAKSSETLRNAQSQSAFPVWECFIALMFRCLTDHLDNVYEVNNNDPWFTYNPKKPHKGMPMEDWDSDENKTPEKGGRDAEEEYRTSESSDLYGPATEDRPMGSRTRHHAQVPPPPRNTQLGDVQIPHRSRPVSVTFGMTQTGDPRPIEEDVETAPTLRRSERVTERKRSVMNNPNLPSMDDPNIHSETSRKVTQQPKESKSLKNTVKHTTKR